MFANPHRVQGFEGFPPSVFLFFQPAIGSSVPRGTNRHSLRFLKDLNGLEGLEPSICSPFGIPPANLRPSIRFCSPNGTPSHWALYSEGCFVLQNEMEAKRQDSNLLPVPPIGGSRPSNIADLLGPTCTVINHNHLCSLFFHLQQDSRPLSLPLRNPALFNPHGATSFAVICAQKSVLKVVPAYWIPPP